MHILLFVIIWKFWSKKNNDTLYFLDQIVNYHSHNLHNSSYKVETRMHSSRMRTGRSLAVCCSVLPGGVSAWFQGGCLPGPGGVSLVRGGCLPGRGGSPWSRGGLPGLGGALLGPGGGFSGDPPLLTESQTRVKT